MEYTGCMNAVKEIGLDLRTMSRIGLKTFFRIAEKWGLNADQQRILLGIQAASTFFKWKKEPPQQLPLDALERLSYIVGIFKALQILLPDSESADAWIKRPNQAPPFGGH